MENDGIAAVAFCYSIENCREKRNCSFLSSPEEIPIEKASQSCTLSYHGSLSPCFVSGGKSSVELVLPYGLNHCRKVLIAQT